MVKAQLQLQLHWSLQEVRFEIALFPSFFSEKWLYYFQLRYLSPSPLETLCSAELFLQNHQPSHLAYLSWWSLKPFHRSQSFCQYLSSPSFGPCSPVAQFRYLFQCHFCCCRRPHHFFSCCCCCRSHLVLLRLRRYHHRCHYRRYRRWKQCAQWGKQLYQKRVLRLLSISPPADKGPPGYSSGCASRQAQPTGRQLWESPSQRKSAMRGPAHLSLH